VDAMKRPEMASETSRNGNLDEIETIWNPVKNSEIIWEYFEIKLYLVKLWYDYCMAFVMAWILHGGN